MANLNTYRFWTFVLIVFLASCQSADDKLRSTVFNYLEAEINYSAPHRVFIYLSDADQSSTTSEAFAKTYPKKSARPDATFKIVSIEDKAELKEVVVEIDEGGKKETQNFLISKNKAGKYRILLGLKEIANIRTQLEKARRLVTDGATDEAQTVVEQVSSRPFRASHPERYDKEIEEVRQYIKTYTERKAFDRRIGNANKLKLSDLRKEIDSLRKDIPEEDQDLQDALDILQKSYLERFKEEAIENFLITNKRVRTVSSDWGFVKLLTFTAVNNTKRTVSNLKVTVEFINSEGGNVLKELQLEVVKPKKLLGVNKEVSYRKELREPPQGWGGKLVNLEVKDISFAN